MKKSYQDPVTVETPSSNDERNSELDEEEKVCVICEGTPCQWIEFGSDLLNDCNSHRCHVTGHDPRNDDVTSSVRRRITGNHPLLCGQPQS